MDVDPGRPIRLDTVREALENLYQNVPLAGSTLGECGLLVAREGGVVERAQLLRSRILGAIEALRPARQPGSRRDAEQRSYDILTLRYVSGYGVQEIAEQLNLGSRQVYRDLRRAEEQLVELLAAGVTPDPAARPDASRPELDAPAGSTPFVEIRGAVMDALALLQPLIAQKSLHLNVLAPTATAWVSLAPGVAREILIQLLSATIQQAASGEQLEVAFHIQPGLAEVRLCLSGRRLDPTKPLMDQAFRLVKSVGMARFTPATQDGCLTIQMVTVARHPVLIVEDNAGARALYDRYLDGSKWRGVVIERLDEVADRASTLQPSALILDILMADIDGWTMLQEIKTDPRVAGLPVIVCSVIDDPELAKALGAAASLAKPLSRRRLLQTLEEVTASHKAV